MADDPSLPPALDSQLDEVLSLLPLVETVPSLADRVFSRLVDCLVEAIVHEVRVRHRSGATGRDAYLSELCVVVADLQARGLLDDGGVPD